MPKKDKDKKQGAAKKADTSDALPQVWLPDQLEITALSYDKGPRIATNVDDPLTPPTEAEQESMARFWAMEEANTSRGWEEEEELDYTEISRKREVQGRATNVETSRNSVASGDPSLFSYAQTSYFTVKLLGHLPDVPSQGNMGSTDSQISTLEAIDTAQRHGRVPWVTSSSDVQILSLSKYGIKVTDDKKQRVFSRHPLQCIANITYYEDTYGKHMVVLRVGQPSPGKTSLNELYIYECSDEAQAKDICLTLAQAFDAVHSKIQLERNLHKPSS